MGSLHQGVCHPTSESAKKHVCAQTWAQWGDGASVVHASCTSTDFTLTDMVLCVRVDGGACTARTVAYPVFPDCSFSDSHADMTALFGLGLGLIVTVFLAKWIYNIFAPSRRSDDPL